MAIFVVAMGSGVATSLIVAALQSNQFSRDNLIALNLAVEGLEAVREIRDANWLRFSFDKELCWNMRPEVIDCNDPSAARIKPGNYIVLLDTASNYDWGLSDPPLVSALDLTSSSSMESYRLFYSDAAHDFYLNSATALADKSNFYRMVSISYSPANNEATDQEMTVTSLVQWQSQGVKHEILLQSKLTNYQKVKRSS